MGRDLFPRSLHISARGGAAALLAAVVAGLYPSAALALDPHRSLHQYVHRVWQTEHGLPQNTVFAIAQTPDGYLWVGTQEGLGRFDGVRFTIFDPTNTPALASKWLRGLKMTRGAAGCASSESKADSVRSRGALAVPMAGAGRVATADVSALMPMSHHFRFSNIVQDW